VLTSTGTPIGRVENRAESGGTVQDAVPRNTRSEALGNIYDHRPEALGPEFKIGGFQVLKKWLSYRERATATGVSSDEVSPSPKLASSPRWLND
jgi:hypothetical protein